MKNRSLPTIGANGPEPDQAVRKKRKRLALLTTVTDDIAIAAPAMTGLSSNPIKG